MRLEPRFLVDSLLVVALKNVFAGKLGSNPSFSVKMLKDSDRFGGKSGPAHHIIILDFLDFSGKRYTKNYPQ